MASWCAQMFTDKGFLKECVTFSFFSWIQFLMLILMWKGHPQRDKGHSCCKASQLCSFISAGELPTNGIKYLLSPPSNINVVSSLAFRLWELFQRCSSLCVVNLLKAVELWVCRAEGHVQRSDCPTPLFIESGKRGL